MAVPGSYTVRLTADGKTLTQPLLLKMDPRIKTPPEGLRAQFDRSVEVAADMARTFAALRAVRADQAKFKEGPHSKQLADRESQPHGPERQARPPLHNLAGADLAPTRPWSTRRRTAPPVSRRSTRPQERARALKQLAAGRGQFLKPKR